MIAAVKDEDAERPIPTVWRDIIKDIVSAFVQKDYELKSKLDFVESISKSDAAYIENNIDAYGATLVALSDETWNSSVCIWMGDCWDVIVDLWTAEEGRSDLVLRLKVTESKSDFIFKIYMVYVP